MLLLRVGETTKLGVRDLLPTNYQHRCELPKGKQLAAFEVAKLQEPAKDSGTLSSTPVKQRTLDEGDERPLQTKDLVVEKRPLKTLKA